MRFISEKKNYGVIKQLIDMSIRAFLALAVIYFATFFLFWYLIDYYIPSTGDLDLNHRLKDLLVYLDIVLCFLIYLCLVIRFINTKLNYIKYLIECIHLMRGGSFNEATKIHGNDELSHLATHIDELRQKISTTNIEDTNRATKQTQLLTSISHDLRTPLTSLIGHLEILQDSKLGNNEKEKRYLNLCLNRSLQLQELINTAFEHFYLEYKESLNIELLRCNSISGLSDIILDRANLLKQHSFTYSIKMPCERYALVYDIRMMERLFDNVFTNIIRYAEKNSNIVINGEINNSNILISVTNPIDICCKRSESTGIGIKNCKKIMKLHDGNFDTEINNALFTVNITLPIQNTKNHLT